MINRYTHKKLTWIDLFSPTQEEVRGLYEEFGIPTAVAESLLSKNTEARAIWFDSCLYLSLEFPSKDKSGKIVTNELDFCIGKDFLITKRNSEINAIHEFTKIFEVDSILNKSENLEHAGFLFYHLMRHLYSILNLELGVITTDIIKIEDDIFSHKERDMVIALSKISRTILDFKQTIRLHGGALESIFTAGRNFFGEDFSFSLKSIIAQWSNVEENASSSLELIRELRDTNNSLLSAKENEAIKTFTSFFIMTLPFTVVPAIFQLSTLSHSIASDSLNFWIIFTVMALGTISLYAYFKHKKWL